MKQVNVGVGVIIMNGKKVLLGKRKKAHGEGTWQFPGGHIDFTETPEACARREVFEETGLTIAEIRRGPYTNDVFLETNKHYVTLFMLADYKGGHPKVMEPDKCDSWEWFSWDELPQPLFLPIQHLLQLSYSPYAVEEILA